MIMDEKDISFSLIRAEYYNYSNCVHEKGLAAVIGWYIILSILTKGRH